MLKFQTRRLVATFVLVDVAATSLAWILAYLLRFDATLLGSFIPVTKGVPELSRYLLLLPVIAVLWPAILYFHGLYQLKRGRSRIDEFFAIVFSVLTGTGLTLGAALYFRVYYRFQPEVAPLWEYSQAVFALFFVLDVALLNLGRWALRRYLERMWAAGDNVKRILVAGAGELGRTVAETLLAHRELGYRVVGFLDDAPGPVEHGGLPVLGLLGHAQAVVQAQQIDQIYARLSAGPIPDGPFDGGILFPRGSSGKFRAAEIMDGLVGQALHLKGIELEAVGEHLWHGKVFFRDERVLRNRIDDLSALKKLGLVEGDPKKTTINGKDAWLLFPAKLYCGQSLFDSRRESIIIDYFFTEEIPGYQEKPDFLAGRRGVRVRDEIRMVRPGFYLGRAYLDRVFGLNFTLYNKAIAEKDGPAFVQTGQVKEDCWPGTQPRAYANR